MSATKIIVETKQAAESRGQSIREWLIAFGTVSATAVAVYVGVLREWRRRPKLSLEYGGPSAGDAVVVKRGSLQITTAYVRLRVSAAKGKSPAEDVEVAVLSAREIEPRMTFPRRAEPIAIEGQLLAWSNSDPPNTRLTISPGAHRHLDLVMVDKMDASSGMAPVQIEVYPIPSDGRHKVKCAKLELELSVGARNADTRRYRLVVQYDGQWGDDDIWDHLIVETPRLVRS